MRISVLLAVALSVSSVEESYAQPVQLATVPAPAGDSNTAAEFLVPPGGGAFEIPIHVSEVCILSFPEDVVSGALGSSATLDVNSWGKDGVAVRANGKASTATLAISTTSGQTKVNVTFRVVAANQPALTLVRFKAATHEEAFNARVAAEVERQMAPVLADAAKAKAALPDIIRDRTDAAIAERILRRNQAMDLSEHERTDDHVVAHVNRAAIIGEDGYLSFEIENHSLTPYRLGGVAVLAKAKNAAGLVRLLSTGPADKDPAVLGVVSPGTTARGVVVVRDVSQVLRKALSVELAEVQGRRKLRLNVGVAFK